MWGGSGRQARAAPFGVPGVELLGDGPGDVPEDTVISGDGARMDPENGTIE